MSDLPPSPRPQRPGRPAFRADMKTRARVEDMRLNGHSLAEIADAIGVSPPTLKKHFSTELMTHSPATFDAMKRGLVRQAAKGDVSAQRTLLRKYGWLDGLQSVSARAEREEREREKNPFPRPGERMVVRLRLGTDETRAKIAKLNQEAEDAEARGKPADGSSDRFGDQPRPS